MTKPFTVDDSTIDFIPARDIAEALMAGKTVRVVNISVLEGMTSNSRRKSYTQVIRPKLDLNKFAIKSKIDANGEAMTFTVEKGAAAVARRKAFGERVRAGVHGERKPVETKKPKAVKTVAKAKPPALPKPVAKKPVAKKAAVKKKPVAKKAAVKKKPVAKKAAVKKKPVAKKPTPPKPLVKS